MAKPIFVLNGPNLNLLGEREPHVYGRTTLAEVRTACEARAGALGRSVVFRQSNHEGELIDWIHEARTQACVLVINPGGYGHTSVALHDALKAVEAPIIELHISNPATRESFRHTSLVAAAATGVIAGFGAAGYEIAIDAAARLTTDDAIRMGPPPQIRDLR